MMPSRTRLVLFSSAAAAILLVSIAGGSAVVHRGTRAATDAETAPGSVGEGDVVTAPVVPTHTRVYAPKGDAAPSVKADGGVARAAQAPALAPDDVYISIGEDDAGRADLGSCHQDSDCKAHEACAIDRGSRRFACLRADCTSDNDCESDMQCRMVGDDQAVARCVKGGRRYAGERCSANPFNVNQACQLGLYCHAGRCGTGCDRSNPASCRAGDECVDSPDGPVCTPQSCKSIGCPNGDRCASISASESACVRAVAGEDCFAHPCAEKGQGCVVSAGMYQTIAYQCARWCSPLDSASCEKGEVCGHGGPGSVCYKKCETPHDCRKGEACQTVSEDLKTMGCVPSAD